MLTKYLKILGMTICIFQKYEHNEILINIYHDIMTKWVRASIIVSSTECVLPAGQP